MFTAVDYTRLHQIVFQPDYPGYRPEVVEAPNGDGYWDTDKRYAHVAAKYLKEMDYSYNKMHLESYLGRAHEKAVEVSVALGVPPQFFPKQEYSALRILDYPPGAVTHPHTDFDLFTLMCYRNLPECFKYRSPASMGAYQHLNEQIHFGELLELIAPGAFLATEHEVLPMPAMSGRHQYSIVYFAIPDHATVLPSGETVGAWLDERMSRSRKAAA